jgi:hypothetical protein
VDVGERTEAIILAELVRRGYRVLKPFGVNQRYDLAIDFDGVFVRAQCKTGRLRRGVIKFSARSVQTNTRGSISRGYNGAADVFLVHCAATDRIYAVPIGKLSQKQMHLRVDPPRNRQARGINWAADYELPG